MSEYHEGQEVEVQIHNALPKRPDPYLDEWRKGKIVEIGGTALGWPEKQLTVLHFTVQFPDGTRAVFDAAHIRVVNLRVSSNDPMGTRPAKSSEMDKWWLSEMAREFSERQEQDEEDEEDRRRGSLDDPRMFRP